VKRRAFGIFLILHGLTHTGLGIWVGDRAPAWIVTLLWLVAVLGFLIAGFALAGVRPVRSSDARIFVLAGALASVLLLLFVAPGVRSAGIALDLLVVGLAIGRPELFAEQKAHAGRRAAVLRVTATAFLAYLGLAILARPWYTTWGTSFAERRMSLPGDAAIPDASYRIDHAITIRAPAEAVWPWILQIGQDRAGFYSYDWLERAFGDDVHNVDSINPAWQERARGDLVRAAQPGYLRGLLGDEPGWRISELEAGRAMVLEGWGAFVVIPVDASTSRFYVRTGGEGKPSLAGVVLAPIGLLVFEPAHFIMERRMLLGVKERAERVPPRALGDAGR
jgi:hypothetical protein